MGNFIFNGVSAADMGLVVERIPRQYSPKKRITTYSIPGGEDLTHWDGTWENYTQSYACWFKAGSVGLQARKIKQWLHAAPAKSRLEDSYDDAVYHLATYAGGTDIENVHERFGRFVVSFDCYAKAYLKTGEIALNITSSGLINNPTPFESRPLIELTGSVSGLLTIGDRSITVRFPGMETQTMRIDCAIQEAWDITDDSEISRNEWLTFTELPVIVPGSNKITITGGIDSVRVRPRWYTV